MKNNEIYCPLCARILTGSPLDDGGYLFTHDDNGVEHTDDDIKAIDNGIQ